MTPIQRRIITARATRTKKPRIAVRLGLAAGTALALMALLVFSVVASALGAGAVSVNNYYQKVVPVGIHQLVTLESAPVGTTRFYDRTGKTLLAELYDPTLGTSKPVHLAQISKWLQEATIAVEDPSFYSNMGIDPRGVTRALYQDVLHQRAAQGGSSITQQLVKNSATGAAPTLQRKVNEMMIAYGVTQTWSGYQGKRKILELYLNSIPYGNQCKGIEAAARFYFHKPAAKLDLAEASLLAGVPRGPSLYDPVTQPDAALARQQVVLAAMVRHGIITEDQKLAATEEAQHFRFHARVYHRQWYVAPHWFYFVRDHLLNDLPGREAQLYSGLKVVTTLDINYYNTAQRLIQQQVSQLSAYGHNANDGALVSINPHTREILCMVGSADWNDSSPAGAGEYNMAVTLRQPGSAFKPFTYVTAFEQGLFPGSVVADVPVRYPDGSAYYEPANYDKKFHGAVTLRFALANSLNIPAVELLNQVGINNMLKTVADFGIPSLLEQQKKRHRFGLSIVLGSGEVSLLDITNAYSVFAASGTYAPYQYIRSITDANGQPVKLLNREAPRRVLAPQYAYQITSILSDNYARQYEFGPNSVLTLPDRPAAVKTGTTNSFRDNWTIGYTPSLVTGVWVGNADYSQMNNVIGIDGAGPVWQQFMEAALGNSPVERFVAPPGMVTTLVSGYNGLLATNSTRWRIRDVFAPGQVPHHFDYGYYNPNLNNIMGEMSLNGSQWATLAETGGATPQATATTLGGQATTGQQPGAPTNTNPAAGTGQSGRSFFSTTNQGNLCNGGYYHWTYAPGGYTITCQ